jgi:hypothetical protein
LFIFYSNFKKSHSFDFDRLFFRASEKMDGHFSKKTYLFIFFRILKNLICLILTVVFFGLPKKWTVIFRKNLFVFFFSIFKKSYLFNFDRRFFGASEKKEGHFSKKIILIIVF